MVIDAVQLYRSAVEFQEAALYGHFANADFLNEALLRLLLLLETQLKGVKLRGFGAPQRRLFQMHRGLANRAVGVGQHERYIEGGRLFARGRDEPAGEDGGNVAINTRSDSTEGHHRTCSNQFAADG